MIEQAVILLAALSTCVLSLPVTSGELENGDVKVMKCVVEALVDILSKPHAVPVSQECLDTLRTDDRLVTILRHHNFLKEMQDIAVSGANKRAQLPDNITVADKVTRVPLGAEHAADQSMLKALGGPGEQSILAQKRRRAGEGDHGEVEVEEEEVKEEKKSQESQQSRESQEQNETGGKEKGKEEEEQRKSRGEKEEEDEGIHGVWMADRPERGEAQEEARGGGVGGDNEVHQEKRSRVEDLAREGLMVHHGTREQKDDDSNLTSTAHNAKPKRKEKNDSQGEEEEEVDDEEALNRTESMPLPHATMATVEEEEEVKRGNDFARWSRQVKRLPMRKKNAQEKEAQAETSSSQQEVAHHSREALAATGGEEEEELRSMALRRAPEDKRSLEEEGSAVRRSEEPEIASLAAIESELENVAQKLHQLRRG